MTTGRNDRGIKITSAAHGTHTVLVDADIYEKIKDCVICLYTTKRHSSCYVQVTLGTEQLKLHRVVMNARDGEIVDHINRNALDNRRCNLRIVNRSINAQNSKKRRDGVTSRYKGVIRRTDSLKWRATITIDGRQMSLGCYVSESEAAQAYDKAALALFGEHASLNFKVS